MKIKIGFRINPFLLDKLEKLLDKKEKIELKRTTKTEAFEEGLRIYISRESIRLEALDND